jgi:hypothetical protein
VKRIVASVFVQWHTGFSSDGNKGEKMKTFTVNHQVLGSITFKASSLAVAMLVARALKASIVVLV